MKTGTTIFIKKSTAKQIKKEKLEKSETYDSIINRLFSETQARKFLQKNIKIEYKSNGFKLSVSGKLDFVTPYSVILDQGDERKVIHLRDILKINKLKKK